MNATDNGGDHVPTTPGLFAEIAELKRQRDDCTRALNECRRENAELREQLEGDK